MSINSLARPEIVAMQPYSSARTEAGTAGVLLNANESPFTLLGNGDPDSNTGINRYPEPQPAQVINRLAALYSVTPERVLVTRGSDEGIDLLVRVFCRAGIDAIAECPPGFGMYRIAAQTQGAAVFSAPRSADDDFLLDCDGVLDCLRKNPSVKLLFLTSPNNPTGDLVERTALLEILEETRNKALVILDEAYIEFSPGHSAIDLLDQYEHLVILRTLSKAWAAAGLRCGTVIADPKIIDLLGRIIAPYPLAGPVIERVNQLLDPAMASQQQTMLEQIKVNKTRLISILGDLPYVQKIWPGAANFVLIRVDDANRLLTHCASGGVIVRGFKNEPLLKDCIRITVGSDAEIDTLNSVLTSWKGH